MAVDVPPPPIQAPPAQVVPAGAEQIALQVEPHESLLPSGRRLQVAALDLPGLRVEIARQLGLQDLRLQVRLLFALLFALSFALSFVPPIELCLSVPLLPHRPHQLRLIKPIRVERYDGG